MNNTRRGYFWGLLCITLGVLFLARNWNLFPMPDWHFVRGLWPILLILGGIALLFRREEAGSGRSVLSTFFTVILAIALPFWLFSYVGRHHRYDRDLSMNFEPPSPPSPPSPPGAYGSNDDDDGDDNTDDNDESDDGDDSDDEDNTDLKSGSYSEDMPATAPAEAKFVMEGGAAKFSIDEPTNRLIDAKTRTINLYNMSIDRNATSPTIRLEPAKNSKANFNFNDNSDFGTVKVQLNDKPLWDMVLDFGAGSGDFDLSRYAVKSLKIDAGAAGIDLKLGDKAAQSDVKISSGMASVKIKVPQSAGVKITTDGGMNATDIDDDFERVGNNTYLSPGYDKATKKITIRYDGGMSHFEVNRY
jgi:Domain of unknown function (DUF5668)